MTAHETPPAPTSEVLDDYRALCRQAEPAITGLLRVVLATEYATFLTLDLDPQQSGEYLGDMFGTVMRAYDKQHLEMASR